MQTVQTEICRMLFTGDTKQKHLHQTALAFKIYKGVLRKPISGKSQ